MQKKAQLIAVLVIAMLVVVAGYFYFAKKSDETPDSSKETSLIDACPSDKVIVSYTNDFRWNREVLCPDQGNTSSCCEAATKMLSSQVQDEKPGMQECPKQVAPYYIDRIAVCESDKSKLTCKVIDKGGEKMATVSDFWGICRCTGCNNKDNKG